MDPLEEKELDLLLREWKAPAPPRTLEFPQARPPVSPWRRLLGYSIRIPVPVAAVMFVLLVYLAVSNFYGKRPESVERPQTVQRPETPSVFDGRQPTPVEPSLQVQPLPPDVVPLAPFASPRTEQALSLAGFQTVPVLEPRIFKARQ